MTQSAESAKGEARDAGRNEGREDAAEASQSRGRRAARRVAAVGAYFAEPDPRTGLRAAVATLIALLVGDWTGVPRAYWAVFIAVALVNGTWGQNLRKSLIRLAMTALGCLAAWGLHALTADDRAARVAVMLGAVFLAAFFRTGSYAWMTFFVTVYVVFLFALLGAATGPIMAIRAYQTFVGCAVAVVASMAVPTPGSRRQGREQVAALREACRARAAEAYARLLVPRPAGTANEERAARELLRQLQDLRAHHQAVRYEGLFFGRRRGAWVATFERMRLLVHLTLALRRSAENLRRTFEDHPLPEELRRPLAALGDELVVQCQARPAPAVVPPADATRAGSGARADLLATPLAVKLGEVARTMESLRQSGRLPAGDIAALAPFLFYTRQIQRLVAGSPDDVAASPGGGVGRQGASAVP